MIICRWVHRWSAVVIIAIAGCQASETPAVMTSPPVVEVGDTLPSIQVKDVYGQSVDLRETTRSGPTIVLVTALRCSLCEYQWKWMREMVASIGSHKLGVIVVAGDAVSDSSGLREKFVITGQKVRLLHDPDNVQAPIFGLESPRVLVLDSSGTIIYSERGTVPAPMTPMFVEPLERLFKSPGDSVPASPASP